MCDPAGARGADRLAGLRARNAAERQRTVDRLRAALAALGGRGDPITAATIREECGLEYASLRRNVEAFALFRQHSTYLVAKRRKANGRRRGLRTPPEEPERDPPQARDPLLLARKPKLVERLRAAEAERERSEQHYRALLQEHMGCAEAILRLRAEVARYEEFLGRMRADRVGQEHTP